jgi:hypothetical protein
VDFLFINGPAVFTGGIARASLRQLAASLVVDYGLRVAG